MPEERHYTAHYINPPTRTENRTHMENMLSKAGLEADRYAPVADVRSHDVATEWDTSGNKLFPQLQIRRSAMYPDERSCAASHVALWQRCSKGTDPLLILEDDALLCPDFGRVVQHLIDVVESVTQSGTRSVVLYLSAERAEFLEHWLSTKLKAPPTGEPLILREAQLIDQSSAYVLWPDAARRLLESLPVNVPIHTFISRHVTQLNVRALLCWPLPAMPKPPDFETMTAKTAIDEILNKPKIVARYTVVFKSRVVVRAAPRSEALIVRTHRPGDLVEAIGHSRDGKWAQVGEKEW
eukprot:CAMPEP_0119303900 /NCGR_PEP_ID=MMETSP1333-20130426/5255_1 /TAXON_ID=418940 /ORGANISM="Scyphosphaera apsteinii, Strain RCC1455" /LENGTH=295 /DNA_ID=CAMNT_0007306679 /DNA_START=175 /DNA_END=1059 /DNA_ORIENTATION=-